MEAKKQSAGNESLWIEQATQGDLDAFNELVLRYQDMAFNHARTLVDDPALAEDVTQDSFIKAFQAIRTFRGGSFRGWLLRIVTHTAYDIMRRIRKHPTQSLFPLNEDGEEEDSPAWLADPNTSVQSAVEKDELYRHIQGALDELPDVYRSVITLIDVQEFDYAEAAQTLNVPIGTVKSRLARARLQMKDKLQSLNIYAGVTTDTNMATAI